MAVEKLTIALISRLIRATPTKKEVVENISFSGIINSVFL